MTWRPCGWCSSRPSRRLARDQPHPTGCFDPDCEFTITVDAGNVIAESDDGNNIAQGVCRS
jgi:hypothetical protein